MLSAFEKSCSNNLTFPFFFLYDLEILTGGEKKAVLHVVTSGMVINPVVQ